MKTADLPIVNGRKKPRQGRARVTVDAILESAAHILVESGYEQLTTNRVAEKAGVSIGSLYQYFPNKEALVGELVDRHCDRLNAIVGETLLSAGELTPRDLARALVRGVYRAQYENPALIRVLRQQGQALGRMGRIDEEMARVTKMVAVYLEAHKGLLRVADPARAAFFAVELGDSLTLASVLRGPACPPEDAIREISDIVIRYLFH